MRLSPDQKAPGFSVADINGHSVDLSSFRGSKVLLTFFRNASCPFCNLRVHHLSQQQKELEARGLQLISVFHSSAEEIHQYMKAPHERLTVIADPGFELYRRYGVGSSNAAPWRSMGRLGAMTEMMRRGLMKPGAMMRSMKEPPVVPADFLINEDQTIAALHYGKDFGDHMAMEIVWRWLEEEQTDVREQKMI